MHVEVLEEALTAKRGRLALGRTALKVARAAPDTPRAPVVRIDGVTRRNQVRMCLVDQRTIRIDVPGRCIRVTHVDLGMARKGNRERTRNWEALVEICEQHGYFKTRSFGGPEATKKRVSRLNYALQDIFGIDESPFHPYRSDSGWRTRFQARPDLPDDLSSDDEGYDADDDD